MIRSLLLMALIPHGVGAVATSYSVVIRDGEREVLGWARYAPALSQTPIGAIPTPMVMAVVGATRRISQALEWRNHRHPVVVGHGDFSWDARLATLDWQTLQSPPAGELWLVPNLTAQEAPRAHRVYGALTSARAIRSRYRLEGRHSDHYPGRVEVELDYEDGRRFWLPVMHTLGPALAVLASFATQPVLHWKSKESLFPVELIEMTPSFAFVADRREVESSRQVKVHRVARTELVLLRRDPFSRSAAGEFPAPAVTALHPPFFPDPTQRLDWIREAHYGRSPANSRCAQWLAWSKERALERTQRVLNWLGSF